jgi:hypothetical protein
MPAGIRQILAKADLLTLEACRVVRDSQVCSVKLISSRIISQRAATRQWLPMLVAYSRLARTKLVPMLGCKALAGSASWVASRAHPGTRHAWLAINKPDVKLFRAIDILPIEHASITMTTLEHSCRRKTSCSTPSMPCPLSMCD